MTYTSLTPKENRIENLDTIKLDPQTLSRLRNYYISHRADEYSKQTLTYTELLNHLLDKVEAVAEAQAQAELNIIK